MFQKKLPPKNTGKIKITSAILVVFCLAQMVAGVAQASASNANFFETGADRAVGAINRFAENIAFAKADLTSFFAQVKCFFGFGCQTTKTAESSKTIAEPKAQTSADSEKGLTPVATGDRPLNAETSAEPEATRQIGGTDGTQVKDVPTTPQTENKTVTIIQPTKEIQTIHTVTNNTNTVVVDEDTKTKVARILRQLDSDRPNYSAGQSFTMPSNLSGKTLNIGSGNFSVDNNGNVAAQTITAAGNFTVQGNFTVSGTQTFSGASALSASTVDPLFSIDQSGAGLALRADNLAFKNSTISTNGTNTAILLDPNGTGAVQFHNPGNYIDSTGNLVLAGTITAASLNAGTGAITGGAFNGLTINPATGTLAIASGKTLTVGDNATLSGTNTGDQTITLTGAVTGAGSGSFATTLTGAGLDNIFSGNGLLKRTGANTYTIDTNNYLTSYAETDPIFSGWNKSTGISIAASQISDFNTGVSANSDVAHGATAYGWGNWAHTTLVGYGITDELLGLHGTADNAALLENHNAAYFQTANSNLNSLAGLSYGSGTPFLKMTGANTFALDTNTYITTLSGALLATGAATGATSQAQTFTNGIIANSTSTFGGNISITGNIVPTASETYSLGSASNPWKDLFVGHASIYVNGQKVLQTDDTDNVVVSADSAQNLIMKTTDGGDIELNPATGATQGQILLKSNVVLTGTKTFGTSDSSAVIFPNGVSTPSITTTVLNGGIAITPNGTGNTYVTAGNFGVGMTAPTARLHLAAGTTTANTAPLKFTSGNLLTVPEAGAMEFFNDAYYGTITTGSTRKTFAFLESPAFAGTVTMPTLSTASGDLTLDPTGNVVIKGSTANNTTAALNITNSTPSSLLFARNDGNIGINNIAPGRKLDITETTSWTPQMRLTFDSSNYAEMYVNSTGNLFLDTTGSSGTSMSILDQNLKVCTGGSMGADTCPSTGFNITGTGNLVVASQVAATDYQRICPSGYIWVPGSAKYGTMPGFCVMKYEAKCSGSVSGATCTVATDTPVSQAANAPWRNNISQENARIACQRAGAGYHLISEAEWMTIADNVAATTINDQDADAGLQLANGHTDNVMTYSSNTGTHDGAGNAAALSDSTKNWTVNQWNYFQILNTTDGSNCWITANTATTITCTLTGGAENDWDAGDAYRVIGPLPALAGTDPAVSGCNLNATMEDASNAYAGTCEIRGDGGYGEDASDKGYYGTGQAWATTGYSAGGANKAQSRTLVLSNGNVIWDIGGNVWEWTDRTIIGQEEPEDATPADEWLEFNAVTKWKGLEYAMPSYGGWTATNGIGRIYTNVGTAGTGRRAFLRGGGWSDGGYAGAFTVFLGAAPSGTSVTVGFRCAR